MNRKIILVAIVLVSTALIAGEVIGRGGGGGGGGGRGGGGGGGGGGNRSGGGGGGSRPSAAAANPSMSRTAAPSNARPSGGAANTANRSAPGNASQAGGARPQQGAGQGSQKFADAGGGNRAPASAATRPAGANSAVADFLGGGSTAGRAATGAAAVGAGAAIAGQQGGRVEGRSGDRTAAKVAAITPGQARTSIAQGRGDRQTQRQQDLGQNADQVRNGLKEQYGGDLYNDFWGSNTNSRFEQNPVFWGWATFNVAQAFMPWNWGSEAYYDYGTGGNVYYEGDVVHSGEATIPAEEYAAQAEQLATSAPKAENPNAEWLPLGVFVLTQEGNNDAVPNMFLQLAVSKEGLLAGTYQNKSTGKTESVEGMVDQKSQRAAFTIAGKNTPIVETGLANLTKNETRALVHFADGQTQQWVMLHVENPQAATK